MITFGISTWSIHRALESGRQSLLDVPAMLRARGMTDLQICHFHLTHQDDAAVHGLRDRIESAGVTLDALLIDFGDLSHPEKGDADAAEMERWLEIAAKVGARHARISAGSQRPTDESLARSARHLLRLADIGEQHGVKVITENWHEMMPSSREVLKLIELTHGRVPLCLDFGNWSGPGKYEELAAIAPHAVTVHAKCAFSDAGVPDAEDFRRCCQILRDANFSGTVALIYDSKSADEWRHIETELELARRVFLHDEAASTLGPR